MHGLAHKAFHGFVLASFGPQVWAELLVRVRVPVQEIFAPQDPAVLDAMVGAAATVLDRPADAILEDFGSHLAGIGQLRRLLRYGGDDFLDFLISLEDLADRCRLALPSLTLPEMRLTAVARSRFVLVIEGGPPGIGHVLTGLVRAMADDYGALALLEHRDGGQGDEAVTIDLVDAGHQAAKAFSLAAVAP